MGGMVKRGRNVREGEMKGRERGREEGVPTDFREFLKLDFATSFPVTILHQLQDVSLLHFKPKGSNSNLMGMETWCSSYQNFVQKSAHEIQIYAGHHLAVI